MEAVTALLQCESIDVTAQDKNGHTPLHEACLNGHDKIVVKLLEYAGTVMSRESKTPLHQVIDNEGNTALHLACESGNVVIVTELLSKGANVLALNIREVSPMHLAARCGCKAIAEKLLERDRDGIMRMTDSKGQTPLHYAAAQNQVDMINLLCERWAQAC